MSELRINNITDRVGSSGPIIAGVSTVSSTSHMVMPSGPTEMRGGRGRGIIGGGYVAPSPATGNVKTIDKIEIATTGDATDFGDLAQTANLVGSGAASATRGIFFGRFDSPATKDEIQYVTISSDGGANDFGDLVNARAGASGLSDNTRGVIASGYLETYQNGTNSMEFVTIATTGDANDFGDLTFSGGYYPMCCASPTRGIIAGGRDANNKNNVIDFITIQSKGNGIKFGELLTHEGGVGCSNSTRGIFAGGYTHPSIVNIITFITISTFGNDTDFGDLTAVRRGLAGTSSSTRAIFAGGQTPTIVNTIDFITIASTGNATNFGDLNSTKKNHAACSDVNGGLGD